jgi:hypothetical protein
VPGERRRYAVPGIGTLRLDGFASRRAAAEAGGRRWRFARPRRWSRTIQATDEAGAVVGAFEPHRTRRGGSLRWAGRHLVLRPASGARERYALVDGERELAVVDGKGVGFAAGEDDARRRGRGGARAPALHRLRRPRAGEDARPAVA